MENTGQVLFQDDSPRWFVAIGSDWIGPLTASDIYERVLLHEVTWAHYVWRKGLPGWSRICDLEEFKIAVPGVPTGAPPASPPKSQVGGAAARAASQQQSPGKAPPTPPSEGVRDWYLYYNDAQFGPFAQDEVERLLRSGRINSRVHAWTAGMEAWSRLMKVSAFSEVAAECDAKAEAKMETGAGRSEAGARGAALKLETHVAADLHPTSVVREQRKAPRAPMTARLLMSDQREVFDALCRDVSTGGMQVLTSQVPGKVGDRLKLNITPGVRAGAKQRHDSPLKPFVAEGVIVRLLEDSRGFSFRFEKLAPEARLAIEEYVKDESHTG